MFTQVKKGGNFQVEGIAQVLAELEHSMYEDLEETGIAPEGERRNV